MKKLLAFLSLVVALLGLTGCGEVETTVTIKDPVTEVSPNVKTSTHSVGVYVPLPDGRKVICVETWQGTAGGVSCDWSTAK